MPYRTRDITPKYVNFTVNQGLYQSSSSYRCRVDFVVKLLGSETMASNGLETDGFTDVINEEKDFILGYN
ncbi:hypothetical protein [Shewanella woodyi]|uniref:Uncharacterized protein n=1 Tax=Shewanella woodyi (strain ATCC 51908 / MS32) TaxID=392500 RepID=B1KEU7_SHEWM|nr:hypothetical protein [Shewanella woodyi]ACA85098.1 hypothetical protein Swoo_0803 [Shewanella woodyi ATCC 51908]